MHISYQSKYLTELVVGALQAKYSVRGIPLRYYIDVRHRSLHLHKELSAPDPNTLENKLNTLLAGWDAKFEEHSGKSSAIDVSVDAEIRLGQLDRILAQTLKVDDKIIWGSLFRRNLYENKAFPEAAPIHNPTMSPKPYYARVTFVDKLLLKRKSKEREAKLEHQAELAKWQAVEDARKLETQKQFDAWSVRRDQWYIAERKKSDEFQQEIDQYNIHVEDLRKGWESGEPTSLLEHASMVLEHSDYQGLFIPSFELDYDQKERLLLVGYDLPRFEDLPSTKSMKFLTSTGEYVETKISEREQKNNFEKVCYQICLRSIHELFESDTPENVSKILFNGAIVSLDKSTGRDFSAIILSVLVDRADFLNIDLSRIDPKSCFKALKGVSAASLATMAPIAPIMKLNTEDRRFVEAQDVVGQIGAKTNLAAMDWEEFEHLVREVFDREFRTRGGEVKITQVSSDGGVDAVAFDPDPITGGKIVIQAKRYTNTVTVGAVRDLYGTVMNEGASKGILVTTTDFGSDAYKFAADKPLTLMTGANLLYLLEKHGIFAKIDIRAARQELGLK